MCVDLHDVRPKCIGINLIVKLSGIVVVGMPDLS